MAKRLKTAKASEVQKSELVKYFEDNPNALRTVNNSNATQHSKQRIWIELAHRLNALDGPLKTTSKWARYWADIIIYTKNRAKSAIAMQDKSHKKDRPPNDLEKRLLVVSGYLSLLRKWEREYPKNLDEANTEHFSDCNENEEIISSENEVDFETSDQTVEYELERLDTLETKMVHEELRESEKDYNQAYIELDSILRKDNEKETVRMTSKESESNSSQQQNSSEFFNEIATSIRTIATALNSIAYSLENKFGK